jgi:carbonic anhydrase
MISASDALQRLRKGNRRFMSDVRGSAALVTQTRRRELADGQEPFAIILGCSDSRVPAEIVFDQGYGDLFVIRVAGTWSRPLKSAAGNLPQNGSAHRWLWCGVTRDAELFLPRWKNS